MTHLALLILRQWLFILLVSPALIGIVTKTKAWVAGRRGPPIFQLYLDIWKLLHKGAVYSRSATWIIRAGPIVSLSACLASTLLIPLSGAESPIGFQGDLILFVYLLGIGRFFTMLAALDTGSAFEGMGASREAAFSCLAEPALFLGLVALAREAGSFSMSDMLNVGLIRIWALHAPALCLVIGSLIIVFLTENSRIPVDDPATHLELTMIHEVMVLDHGGPDLAFIESAAAVKFFTLGAVLVRIVHPVRSPDFWAGSVSLLGGLVLLSVAVGLIESSMARLRLNRIPQLLVSSGVLAGFGVILTLVMAP